MMQEKYYDSTQLRLLYKERLFVLIPVTLPKGFKKTRLHNHATITKDLILLTSDAKTKETFHRQTT